MKLSFLLWLATLLPQPAADHVCLATTVYLEARSESQVGQMAVAEVAMRRRENGRWGATVCDVVRAPGQFATATTNVAYRLANPRAWQKAWAVAGRAIETWSLPSNRRKLVVPNADHFILADSISPAWIKGPPLATIGAHNFYRVN
jgi:spore germination cell wall hydrolase CwlJ-like protein